MGNLSSRLIARLRGWYLRRYGIDNPSYWKIRGRWYRKEFRSMAPELAAEFAHQEERIVEVLRLLTFSSVLELGCGFGRVLRLVSQGWPEVALHGRDVSEDQVNAARVLLKDHRGSVDLALADIRQGEWVRDGGYDLVYTCEVCIHLPDIRDLVAGMLRSTRRHVMHVEWQGELERPTRWMFSHDYRAIYQALGYPKVREWDLCRGQRIFVIDKE